MAAVEDGEEVGAVVEDMAVDGGGAAVVDGADMVDMEVIDHFLRLFNWIEKYPPAPEYTINGFHFSLKDVIIRFCIIYAEDPDGFNFEFIVWYYAIVNE